MTEQQAIERLQQHVRATYEGSYRKCFIAYDVDADNKIGTTELEYLLADAGIGNRLTRGAWAKGIIDQLDGDLDGRISWEEFESAIQPTKRSEA